MTIPRDISGNRLAALLSRYGYHVTRQTGSHMRLTSVGQEHAHHITIPQHKNLRVGTLHSILSDVALYLARPVQELKDELFS